MSTNEEAEDILKMREEIVRQCLAGKPLFGKDGAFSPIRSVRRRNGRPSDRRRTPIG